MKNVTLLLGLVICNRLGYAQGTMLLRQPTINNTHISFVYANDLWIVPKEGGDAKRLTSNEGQESLPHFRQTESGLPLQDSTMATPMFM